MHKKLFLTSIGLAVLLAIAAFYPLAAITWGEPDGEEHPNVGILVFDDEYGPAWRCTGTLISPNVVLTAGHCTDGAITARVWFDTDLRENDDYPVGGATSIEGIPVAHPEFEGLYLPNTHDVGVVILSEPVVGITPATLPEIGAVDALDQPTTPGRPQGVRIVGYGLQAVVPDLMADRVRYQAIPMVVETRSALTGGYNLHLSANPGKGNGTGGTCFGDSGGPAFFEDAQGDEVIAAVTSFGLNFNCVGAGYSYRVDTEEVNAWINEQVTNNPPSLAGKPVTRPASSTWGQLKSIF